jgi:hypothetical protein
MAGKDSGGGNEKQYRQEKKSGKESRKPAPAGSNRPAKEFRELQRHDSHPMHSKSFGKFKPKQRLWQKNSTGFSHLHSD